MKKNSRFWRVSHVKVAGMKMYQNLFLLHFGKMRAGKVVQNRGLRGKHTGPQRMNISNAHLDPPGREM